MRKPGTPAPREQLDPLVVEMAVSMCKKVLRETKYIDQWNEYDFTCWCDGADEPCPHRLLAAKAALEKACA